MAGALHARVPANSLSFEPPMTNAADPPYATLAPRPYPCSRVLFLIDSSPFPVVCVRVSLLLLLLSPHVRSRPGRCPPAVARRQ